jgi:hypothetical protein
VPEREPLLELIPNGGEVVVTRFECATWRSLTTVLLLHLRVKPKVKRFAHGFLGSSVFVDWQGKVVLSVSMWASAKDIYSMGNVPHHILATRVPGRIGVMTTSGVYSYTGDWRRVLFRSWSENQSPLRPIDRAPSTRANPERMHESRGDTDVDSDR